MVEESKIYVAGHRGMVGSAIWRALQAAGYHNLIGATSSELDLREQSAVRDFFALHRPEFVFLSAARVGGIHANNTYRADFLYDNLAIEMNVIHESFRHEVKKLLFLGSSCIYPRNAAQPMREEALLTGTLEHTNEPYAIAKIAGIKLCEAYWDQHGCRFISAMPTNLYGPNDNYDLQQSHVLPALIRKFHEAKESGAPEVEVWGTGSPLREFLHVDDLASACLFLMEHYDEKLFVNVGSSSEISIRDLALMIRDIVGYTGEIRWNTDKPDGTPRKLMDNSRMEAMGWRPQIALVDGIREVYREFKEKHTELRMG